MTDAAHPRDAILLLVVFALVGIVGEAQVRTGDAARGAAQAAETQAQTRAAADPGAEAPHELSLTVGKSLIVNSARPIDRVAVGYGDFAEATPVGLQEVLINGKAPGETSLIIWQQGGSKLFFDLSVRPSTVKSDERVDTIRRQLKKEFPDQQINLAFENDIVFLRGRVKNLVNAERALSIASTLGKVVNLLYVDVPDSDEQIILKVQFASVDRSVQTDLGMNLVSTGATNTVGSISTGQFPSAGVAVPPNQKPQFTISDALNIFMLRPDLNLGAWIKALQNKGLVEILAEPNVLAINGKQASFLAGGEFPYPTIQGGGVGVGVAAVTIAFKEFGVRINFIPFITARGTVKLEVAPEVSALDFASGLTFQGFTIPALTTRRVHTEIELDSGQSFAIGGLLDRRLTETLEKIPLLADVPLLGKLFRSRSLKKQNTELLVLVTPERVRPVPEGRKPPAIDMPVPLQYGPDKAPRTPGMDITGPAPSKQPEPMPIESLRQSIQAGESITLQTPQGGTRDTSFQPQKEVTPAPVPAATPPPPAAPPQQ